MARTGLPARTPPGQARAEPHPRPRRTPGAKRAAGLVAALCAAVLPGCAGRYAADPALRPLAKFVDGPALALSSFLGPPSESRGTLELRTYRWNYRDAQGTVCSLTARVDGVESVIEITRSGSETLCARRVEERMGR
ncbi:MAG: hypothetical protein IT514_02085 [Burkholderiales bacterium]|nr:hypothetical protein [Burkholderiales bacterium]